MIYNFPYYVLSYVLIMLCIIGISYCYSANYYKTNNKILTTAINIYKTSIPQKLREFVNNSYHYYAILMTSVVTMIASGLQLIITSAIMLNSIFTVVSVQTAITTYLTGNGLIFVGALIVLCIVKHKLNLVLLSINNHTEKDENIDETKDDKNVVKSTNNTSDNSDNESATDNNFEKDDKHE